MTYCSQDTCLFQIKDAEKLALQMDALIKGLEEWYAFEEKEKDKVHSSLNGCRGCHSSTGLR